MLKDYIKPEQRLSLEWKESELDILRNNVRKYERHLQRPFKKFEDKLFMGLIILWISYLVFQIIRSI